MKNDSMFLSLVSFPVIATLVLLGAPSTDGQSEPEEKALIDSTDHIEMSGPRIRCGKYFVLESRSYTGFEVKQVHVVLPLSSENVALVSLYYGDIQTILDESKDSPVLMRTKDKGGRERDVVRLSKASFEEAKECLPPPGEN